MPYEIKEEFAKTHNLSEDVIKAINADVGTYETTEWVPKANKDAQGIIDGAIAPVAELTGIEREKGEKAEPYFKRVGELYPKGKLEAENKKIQKLQTELEEKIKNGNGDPVLKEELEALKKKAADFDKFIKDKDDALKSKDQELSQYKIKVAFNGIKPTFHKDSNKFEVKAKWNEFMKVTQEKYDIKMDDEGEPWAIDKTNEFNKIKLSDLAAGDESLKGLAEGRKIDGSQTTHKTTVDLDGVPFKLPENATKAEVTKAITEYLVSKKIPVHHDEYGKEFAKLYNKIREAQKK